MMTKFSSVVCAFVGSFAELEDDSASLLTLKAQRVSRSWEPRELRALPSTCKDYSDSWKDVYNETCKQMTMYGGDCIGYVSSICVPGSFCAGDHGDDGYFQDQTCCDCGRGKYLKTKHAEAEHLWKLCRKKKTASVCRLYEDAREHVDTLLNRQEAPQAAKCTLPETWNAGADGAAKMYNYTQCLQSECEDGLQFALSENAQRDPSLMCGNFPSACDDDIEINDWGFTFKDLCPNFCSNGLCDATTTTTSPPPKACTVPHSPHVARYLVGQVVQHGESVTAQCRKGYEPSASTSMLTCEDGAIAAVNCKEKIRGRGRLVVTVARAVGLRQGGIVGRLGRLFGNDVDPFVEVEACEEKPQKRSTKYLNSIQKPIWDTEFSFDVDAGCRSVNFNVLDYDNVMIFGWLPWAWRHDDELGRTRSVEFRATPCKPQVLDLEVEGEMEGQRLHVALEWQPAYYK